VDRRESVAVLPCLRAKNLAQQFGVSALAKFRLDAAHHLVWIVANPRQPRIALGRRDAAAAHRLLGQQTDQGTPQRIQPRRGAGADERDRLALPHKLAQAVERVLVPGNVPPVRHCIRCNSATQLSFSERPADASNCPSRQIKFARPDRQIAIRTMAEINIEPTRSRSRGGNVLGPSSPAYLRFSEHPVPVSGVFDAGSVAVVLVG
jgi:hypothetical protein